MGEAKRRKKLDKNYGKKSTIQLDKFKILDFDGNHYAIQNLSIKDGIKAKSPEEALAKALAVSLGVPGIGRNNIAWVSCKKSLNIGSVVRGQLSGDPAKLAKQYKFAELIILDPTQLKLHQLPE